MAATAHSDPYSILLRKIGYSVGLEFTAERIKKLTSRYLQDRDINNASWHQLVTGSKNQGYWGRDQSAEKHIADFFSSLRLIQRTAGDVLALENLDALAIVSELLSDEKEKRAAQDFIFLWAVMSNDGEIFTNLLLAGFEEKAISNTLTTMMLNKRSIAAEALKGKAPEQRINRIITIERQEKNEGSKGGRQSITSLIRTTQLPSQRSSGPGSDDSYEIVFSNDYFRKVPPRRRDWAISLGLWDGEKGLTPKGNYFLESLRHSKYIDKENCFTYWPMDYELVRAGFRPNIFGDAKGLWDSLVDFSSALAGLQVPPQSIIDQEATIDLIRSMMEIFRSLHTRKLMLRRELPITIAYPAAMALHYAKNNIILDLPAAIFAEQKGEQRRVALRQSRHTGGALSIKR